jgi:hypothetical protein
VTELLLEPVVAGQTRFKMQGLQPDARGIAIGRELLLVFPSLDWLVSFLGAYSDEATLDDLLPTMTIEQAQREGGGHGMLLRCAAGDGYVVERLARLATATRANLYTGTGAVFIRWRDRDAPFGYDLLNPIAPGEEEVAVVDPEYVAQYKTVSRIDPVELIQRLQLRPTPLPLGGISSDPELLGLKEMALALVAPGLVHRVLRYLWRLEVPFAGYYVALDHDRRASLLLRLRQPRGRVVDMLHKTPGVELFAPVSPRVALEVGYRHPIQLASVSSAFGGQEMFLFRGGVGRIERLDGPPRFVEGRHLVAPSGVVGARDVGTLREADFETLRVELFVRPSTAPREPRGVLIDWKQAFLLRRLVYLIPPSALAAARVVPLDQGIVVLAGSKLGARSAASAAGLGAGSLIPLGLRLGEVAPGVLVRDGYELWPQVRPELLRSLLGLQADDHALFLAAEDEPIRIAAQQLLPLDAALVSRLRLADIDEVAPEAPELGSGMLQNERLSRFSLWGFGGEKGPPGGGLGQ